MAKLLIKEICKQQGIPLKIMADKMGMSASTFTQFINSPNPSIPTLERIASVLKVNVGDLFSRQYKRVTGFVSTDAGSVTITSKEDWVNASRLIDGLVKVPIYADLASLRIEVEKFIGRTLKSLKNDCLMAQLGADEIIVVVASAVPVEMPNWEDKSYVDFSLVKCVGDGSTSLHTYSTQEYTNDLPGMISDLCNDIEAIYEDAEFGTKLK